MNELSGKETENSAWWLDSSESACSLETVHGRIGAELHPHLTLCVSLILGADSHSDHLSDEGQSAAKCREPDLSYPECLWT